MPTYPQEPLAGFVRRPPEELVARSRAFRDAVALPRTVRGFAPDPVPREVIAAAIEAAGRARGHA